jgi:hypothetical protein
MCCSFSARVSKTKGVETLVKDFPTTVHQRKGKVVYVNLTQPTKEWKEIIDFTSGWSATVILGCEI